MRKTILILGGIALLMFLLVARLFFKQKNGMKDERFWFAKNLQYEFSAQIDTIIPFNDHAGRLRCILTDGHPDIEREDSLKKHFKEHDMLYLIYRQSGDTLTFILPFHAKEIAKGDSLRVSSGKNSIRFFRKEKEIFEAPLNEALTGFSRPFFLKGKK